MSRFRPGIIGIRRPSSRNLTCTNARNKNKFIRTGPVLSEKLNRPSESDKIKHVRRVNTSKHVYSFSRVFLKNNFFVLAIIIIIYACPIKKNWRFLSFYAFINCGVQTYLCMIYYKLFKKPHALHTYLRCFSKNSCNPPML